MKRTLLKIVVLLAFLAFWYWADDRDYFRGDFNELSAQEQAEFTWQDSGEETGDKLNQRYRDHFSDTAFTFPKQQVTEIKLFRNIPIVGVFTGRKLKLKLHDDFLAFCNDSINFSWGETTWQASESDYYIRLYNGNSVVGKLYVCLDDCGMTSARPFCPAMKFGMLSKKGLRFIQTFIETDENWR